MQFLPYSEKARSQKEKSLSGILYFEMGKKINRRKLF